MYRSQKQAALLIRAIASRRSVYAPKRFKSTGISDLLHDSLGVKLPREPIILPKSIALDFNDRLAKLRADIDLENAAGVWTHFSDLWDAGQANNLSLKDLEEVDRAIAFTIYRTGVSRKSTESNKFSPNFSSLKARIEPPMTLEQMHELGIWLGVRGPMCVLRGCMIQALRRSEPQIVLNLWESYTSRCLAGEGEYILDTASRPEVSSAVTVHKPNDNPLDSESSTASQATPQQNVLTYHPGRPELLQFTICAHAMQDDFRGAFNTVYSTLVPLKSDIARDSLEPVIQIREDAVTKALRYINDLDLLRLLARPWSFRNHLSNFIQTRHVEKFKLMYEEILRLLKEPDPWVGLLSVSPGYPPISPDPKSKPIFSISRQTWSDLLEGAGTLRRPDLRETIWRDFISLGGTPTTGMWNILMLGYLREGQLEAAEKVWGAMGKDGHDAHTYTTMMRGLFDRGHTSHALAYYEEMKRKIPQADIGIRSYNVVIHGLFTSKRSAAALQLIADLEAGSVLPTPTHPAPDITTYNTMLRYYSRRREMSPLSKVLHTIADRQLPPDTYTLATILDALLAVGAKDAPSRILQIMKSLRVQVNEAIASELIEDIVYRVPGRDAKKRDRFPESTRASSKHPTSQDSEFSPRDRLHTGIKMLVAFEEAGVKTNVVNYTSLMAAFHRAAGAGTGPQSISHSEAQQATRALRTRMQKRKIHENRVTYNILIAACLEGGDVPKSKWRETPATEGNRPAVDLNTVPPNVEQAVRYFHEMRSAGVLPNHDTWYTLLQGVASHGQILLARVLCDELVKMRFIPQTGLLNLIMQIKGGY
ncbi:hypothetical protein RSOLAG1IB_02120 [Rhizoctonia solani AG-1 IB]|uniref:Uncharacterized protein n=1 Tax=Thanatephorus cucumeris (strain AG1-IB / isolate 7/3/14) TaxID=1108050 RepID=A0A0B7FHA6_THACB|nr:hypothetical protein RSOLAG1IB_02120 [Rhizoctonia solani AG-1 IB]